MDFLAWIPSEKRFLKVQAGTGDNLTRKDVAEGYVDYVLWSTFWPVDIGLDGDLPLDCTDSGMICFRDELPFESEEFVKRTLPEVYFDAFRKSFSFEDVHILLTSDDMNEEEEDGAK